MATGNGTSPPGYTVSLTADVRARLRTWGAYAVRHGLLGDYIRGLDGMQQRLQTGPGRVGRSHP